jgi:tRNA (guanine-N7-)-methyltransferase
MRERRWVNPYIERLPALQALIIGNPDGPLSEPEIERVRSLCAVAAAVSVELGSGSGGHLIGQAQRHSGVLWLGVELRFKRLVRTAEKAIEQGLTNVQVVRTDGLALDTVLEPQSINALYVNFPDPWDKRRWKKHRLLSAEALTRLYPLLRSGAEIHFKTDHQGYFEDVLAALSEHGGLTLTAISRDLHRSELVQDNVVTEFEQLFLQQGLPIYYVSACRSG